MPKKGRAGTGAAGQEARAGMGVLNICSKPLQNQASILGVDNLESYAFNRSKMIQDPIYEFLCTETRSTKKMSEFHTPMMVLDLSQ